MLLASLQVMDVMSSRKSDSASSITGERTRIVQGGYPERLGYWEIPVVP
jgi:hypothetical protein